MNVKPNKQQKITQNTGDYYYIYNYKHGMIGLYGLNKVAILSEHIKKKEKL